jgi:SAM-dependent methyltransferase
LRSFAGNKAVNLIFIASPLYSQNRKQVGKSIEDFNIKWYSAFYNPFFFTRKRLYDNLAQLAPMLKGNVLDFGCGAKPYKKLFTAAASYTGIDIEVSGHSHKNEQVDVYYDGKTIPFADGHFDHIFSTEVFEHVFNIDEVLPEVVRVLKPGGYLLITCPFVWPEHERPYDYARYTSFGIKHLLEKHGLEIAQQIKTGNFIETLAQLNMFLLYCYLPKKPKLLYLVLHQIFILPIIAVMQLMNAVLPARVKRSDLYLNNIVLAKKR